ncbi:hypothetical protein GGF31_002980 [Allomyces arbusculus]|nr:hypothetical protein GGF31_002980 [Allomyces arbusculus]
MPRSGRTTLARYPAPPRPPSLAALDCPRSPAPVLRVAHKLAASGARRPCCTAGRDAPAQGLTRPRPPFPPHPAHVSTVALPLPPPLHAPPPPPSGHVPPAALHLPNTILPPHPLAPSAVPLALLARLLPLALRADDATLNAPPPPPPGFLPPGAVQHAPIEPASPAHARESVLDLADRAQLHAPLALDTLGVLLRLLLAGAPQAQVDPAAALVAGVVRRAVAVAAHDAWWSALAHALPRVLAAANAAPDHAIPAAVAGEGAPPAAAFVQALLALPVLAEHERFVLALLVAEAAGPADAPYPRALAIDHAAQRVTAYTAFRASLPSSATALLDAHVARLVAAAADPRLAPAAAAPSLSPSSTTPAGMASSGSPHGGAGAEDHDVVADFLRKAGYNVLATPDLFVRVLAAHLGSPAAATAALQNPLAVGLALGVMAMTHTNMDLNAPVAAPWTPLVAEARPRRSTWDLDVFVHAVVATAPDLDWTQAIRALDSPTVRITDLVGLKMLVDAHRKATRTKKFPVHVLFEPWRHPVAQYTLLAQAVSAPPDTLNFAEYADLTRIVPPEELAIAAAGTARAPITALPNRALNTLDVLATFVHLLRHDACRADVAQFLVNASVQAPELLLLGLVQLETPWDPVHADRVAVLTGEFLLGRPTAPFVLPRLWALNPTVVITRMVELHAEDPARLGRLLDVIHDLKALGEVLARAPFAFTLDLAALASRREYLHLEKWVQDMLRDHRVAFATAAVEYLQTKLAAPASATSEAGAQQPPAAPLSPEVPAVLMAALTAQAASLPADVAEAIAALAVATKTESGFMRHIEDQVIRLFDLYYKTELALPDFLAHLAALKAATHDPAAQDVYQCAVTTIMEETKFVASYPERNLYLSALFLGQLIAHDLLADASMTEAALQVVLDALQEPIQSKMFGFGFRTLGQFVHRAHEFPEFAKQLVVLPSLMQHAPEMVQLVEARLPSKTFRSLQVDSDLIAAVPTVPADGEASADASSGVLVPPSAIKDKLLFIVNNLSTGNVADRTRDAADLLSDPAYYRWFAEYLVTGRAAIEPNNQPLYATLLKTWAAPLLDQCVLHETYRLADAVLNSERTVESSIERAKLKNVGTWLGGLTLARNVPIKHKHLAFKPLLLEGYDQGRLMVVVPFVCKILEQAKHSKVFLPPNPWLMAVLALLVELYHEADIKLNLKFEIEVLCKNLSVEIADVKPSSLLKTRRSPAELAAAAVAAAGFGPVAMPTVPGGVTPGLALPPGVAGADSLPPHLAAAHGAPANSASPAPPAAAAAATVAHPYAHVNLHNLASYLVFNPAIPLFTAQPGVKRLVHVAFERAIREIMAPVVDRSVTIAGISTRELVLKDFATEPDEAKVRQAALAMAQHLAGSLALVTSKEPLRLSMASQLRALLLQNGLTENVVSEPLLLMVVNDNLDLGCHLIERAAMDKAAPEMRDQLAPHCAKRMQAREVGKPFFDASVGGGATAEYRNRLAGLPDPLRLKLGGLAPHQLAIYDEYSRLPHAMAVAAAAAARGGASGNAAESPLTAHPPGSSTASVPQQQQQQAQSQPALPAEDLTLQQAVDRFTKVMADIDAHLAALGQQSPQSAWTDVPAHHDVRHLMRQVPALVPGAAAGQASRDDLTLMFCSKVIQPLFATSFPIARDAYAALLRDLCALSPRVGREVVQWLLYADDERKVQVAPTVALVAAGVLAVPDIDAQLARSIEAGYQGDAMPPRVAQLVDFAVELIEHTLARALAVETDWFQTVDVLNRLAMARKAAPHVGQLIATLRRRAAGVVENGEVNGETASAADMVHLKEQLAYTFAEWVRLVQHPHSTEPMHAAFVHKMHAFDVLKHDHTFALFFRIGTELAVEAAAKAAAKAAATAVTMSSPPSVVEAYQAVDALAKLIVLLVKYKPQEPVGGEGKMPNGTTASESAELVNMDAVVAAVNRQQQPQAAEGDEAAAAENSLADTPSRPAFFKKILAIITLVLVGAHESQGMAFDQRAYFRLIASLFHELNAQEQAFCVPIPKDEASDAKTDKDTAAASKSGPQPADEYEAMLFSLCDMLHTLQPTMVPRFTFGWAALLAHRQLMPKLLLLDDQRGWPVFQRLLLALLRFLVPFLREGRLNDGARVLYRGTLRMLLVLLHDFPEFLGEQALALCAVIPSSCLQLRNLVLSAFPRAMRLPDPFSPTLRMAALPEVAVVPNVDVAGLHAQVRAHGLDPTAPWDAAAVASAVRVPPNGPLDDVTGSAYHVALIGAIVTLAGHADVQAAADAHQGQVTVNGDQAASAPPALELHHVDFFRALLAQLDSEGRHHVLSAMANHLRFPNAHTRYFSTLMLALFLNPGDVAVAEAVQEQITRVLLERLIVNRPHPWGLLVTFIELIRDPQYAFWTHGFTRCAPDLERLFEGVSRSVNHH